MGITNQSFRGHGPIVDRIKKSLYYGKVKESSEVMECPSLPLTEATVEMFEKAMKEKCAGARGFDVFDLNYASTVSEKACISPCSVVLAIIYMERLKTKNPEYMTTVSSCDLFLVSMMVASKFLFDDGEDEEVFNDEWAASGSMELKALNRLEREFLGAIDWDLHVDPATFFAQLSVIETLVTWNQARKRVPHGFTYNELISLSFDASSPPAWSQFSDNLLKIIMVASATYSALVLSLFGATLVACSFQVMLSKSLAPYSASTPVNNSLPLDLGNRLAGEPFKPIAPAACEDFATCDTFELAFQTPSHQTPRLNIDSPLRPVYALSDEHHSLPSDKLPPTLFEYFITGKKFLLSAGECAPSWFPIKTS